MNLRGCAAGFLLALCLATLWGVWAQRTQLLDLRAEQQQLAARLAAADPAPPETGATPSQAPPPALVATSELLRLRAEVTRLTERRRELASVRGENERLRAGLADRSTKAAPGHQFPPGYVRKSDARLVGYSTPEDTLQSLL